MCQVLEVSRSGFYEWQGRGESPRAVEQGQLDAAIKNAYHASKGRSGSPKITRSLRKEGWAVSKNRVARQMRQLQLRALSSAKAS
jgi:transposase InsO family protein